jgi:hypothetical protein
MITSKLNGKAQTAIQQPVQQGLCMAVADRLADVVEDDRIIDPIASWGEWKGADDAVAYADLKPARLML